MSLRRIEESGRALVVLEVDGYKEEHTHIMQPKIKRNTRGVCRWEKCCSVGKGQNKYHYTTITGDHSK